MISPDLSGEITAGDLEKALSVLRNRPENPEALKKLISALDKNKDGKISIEELEAYADALDELEGVGIIKEDKKDSKK